jgi:D-amino peptidase
MKIYISVDMEGVSNVVMPYQLFPSYEERAVREVREAVTREINAAIEGAAMAGATEFLVNENHTGKEIIPEMLDERAIFLAGKPKYLMTAEGIEGCDALFLIGIHSKMGTKDGVMDHTWIPKSIASVRVNGIEIGEIGLNTYLAAHYGIPLTLVTGDRAACMEAEALIGMVETVAVKEGSGRFAAYCPHPEINRKKIKEAAIKAVENHKCYKPLKLETPVRMEIDFTTQHETMLACLVPGSRRASARTVAFIQDNFFEAMKVFCLCGLVCHGTETIYGISEN